MTSKDRYDKALGAFQELKSQQAIAQLNEKSNFDEAHRLLKNYLDRYFPMFVVQNPDHKWYLEDDIIDILKRAELKADVSEYEFVKTKVDSALALITDLLADTEKSI